MQVAEIQTKFDIPARDLQYFPKIREAISSINRNRVRISNSGALQAYYPTLEAHMSEFIEYGCDQRKPVSMDKTLEWQKYGTHH